MYVYREIGASRKEKNSGPVSNLETPSGTRQDCLLLVRTILYEKLCYKLHA